MVSLIRNKAVTSALAALCFGLSAYAPTASANGGVFAAYEVSAAYSNAAFYNGASAHALWFENSLGTDFIFSQNGLMLSHDDGTATLAGDVVSASDGVTGFSVSLSFSGYTAIAPPGSPKKELASHAYVENGGPIDTATWHYYMNWSGTLVGTGALAGTELTITQRGPAFQFGVGANGKNILLGGSGWFDAVDQNGNAYVGDFNLDMQAVPVPAALPLLLSALAGLGFAARRK